MIGGNSPPEETPAAPVAMKWDAVKIHLDDLLDLVRGVTGVEIADQAQADTVGKLLRDLQDGAKLADQARTSEKQPLDEQIKEIQDRYNEYIAPLKNKVPGLVSKAELALKNQVGAWLKKLDDERIARENAARAVAEKAAEEARAAHQIAKTSDDLDDIEAAEDLLAAADQANRDLRQAEKVKAQVKTEGHRAIGLRSVWRAERIEGEGGKALSHYAKTQPARVIAFIEELAAEDVKAGIRSIPGFNIVEDKVAA
ncbi:MAG TPA: hypothetical protein VJM09_04815 [Sphingobium sp.]|nr:hypothetical protein [Sphingobium sp.]